MGFALRWECTFFAAVCLLSLGCVHAVSVDTSRLVETPMAARGLTTVDGSGREPRRIAGYFKLDRTYEAKMFYFFFDSRSANASTDPLVLWMTGGPGCSSELAVFYENGPFKITPNLTLEDNPYGWDVGHNMIFVDQPINTGFSYSDDPRDRVYNEHVVAADMLDFMHVFLKKHPEFTDNDFFVTGESYGGHYVPAVSHAIWQSNANRTADERIHLKGVAIGNGLTDPAIQYGAYADFSLRAGLIGRGLHDSLNAVYPICKFGINLCNYLKWDLVCSLALNICQSTIVAPIQVAAGNFNVYDIRKECIGPLCYDFSRLDAYLAQPAVRADLGVGDRTFQQCNPDVFADFAGDFMRTYENLVSDLLEDDVRVMVYVGVEDWICNWLGNKRWTHGLPWSGQAAFLAAPMEDWAVAGRATGTVREHGPLSYVKVEAAGHMVPMDQPEAALAMITRFTTGRPLGGAAVHQPALRLPTTDAPVEGRMAGGWAWLRAAVNA